MGKVFETVPGFKLPEWTEVGREAGLDPLGMARPSEEIYQSLLPGISTITVRLRYYSFLPWLLHTYISGGRSADPEEFFRFQRNAEAVFALIGVFESYDGGLAGANWALRTLSEQRGETIDFAVSAQQDTNGLLKNKSGALGGIYGPQLAEMGLITTSADHGIKVPTERGTNLAKAFEQTLGSLAPEFKTAIVDGRITRTNLQRLSFLKPSGIDVSSKEGQFLASIFLGETEDPLSEDLKRRDSLRRILEVVRIYKCKPKDYQVRWHWFKALRKEREVDPWLAYHVNDLLIFAYEALLKRSLEVMREQSDGSIPLQNLVEEVVSKLCEGDAKEPFLVSKNLTGDEEKLVEYISMYGQSMEVLPHEGVVLARKLIQIVLGWAKSNATSVRELFPLSSSFHSLSSELGFVESLADQTVEHGLRKILVERVLKRHLWVAAKKFRGQKKYTFLFEIEDGGRLYRLRYRNPAQVKLGYPRITQAIQFLEDAKLIDDENGLTHLGEKVLNST